MIFQLNPRQQYEFLQEHFIFLKSLYQTKAEMRWDAAAQVCVTVSRFSLLPSPLQAVYMFYALAIVCDDFFVPSLEKICEVSVRRCSCLVCCFHSSYGEPQGVVVVYLLLSCSVASAACLVARHNMCVLTQLPVLPHRTGSPGASSVHTVVVAVQLICVSLQMSLQKHQALALDDTN